MTFNYRKSVLLLAIVLIFTLAPVNIFASTTSSKTVIKMTIGSSSINVDGVDTKSEKAYRIGKNTYIPLKSVFEAIGAEVVWQGNGRVNVLFRSVSIDLKVGKKSLSMNHVEKSMDAAPILKNSTVMIPTTFVKLCFENEMIITEKNNKIEITLKNDGSLSDLSFLTGSITKPRVGNSYFGWSIDVPKGSRISYQSFNSKTIQIDNEHRGFGLDVYIDLTDGRKLEEYYEEIKDDPENILNGELLDSSINTNASPAYIELLYTDEYDEAVYQRVYSDARYFYNVSFLSFTDSNPEVLSNDSYIVSLFKSFKLGFKGGIENTADLSSVQYGLAQYNNYILSSAGDKKYTSWKISVLPEWDLVDADKTNPYKTEFGAGIEEKSMIEVSSSNGQNDVEELGKDVEEKYSENFNANLYKLIKSETTTTSGFDTYHMIYDVKLGKKQYRYDERYIIDSGVVYNITFKSKLEDYDSRQEQYKKMLDTFEPIVKDATALVTDMEKFSYDTDKKRMGKDDGNVLYENNKYGWTLTFPGNWLKNSAQGQSVESFYNSDNSAVILFEAVDKKLVDVGTADDKKFSIFKIVDSMGLDPLSVDKVKINNIEAQRYKFRIEDDENDDFADVWYYTFEDKSCYYCFMSSIPDLTASTSNLATIDNIRESVTLTEIKD
jgi:Copper amine oxidase N-terminal domain.